MNKGEFYEQQIYNHYAAKGYNVEMTPRTNDHGIDLISEGAYSCAAIQCKHTNKNVGREVLQKLESAMHYNPYEREFSHGIVVSSIGFTKNAYDLAYEINQRYGYNRFTLEVIASDGSEYHQDVYTPEKYEADYSEEYYPKASFPIGKIIVVIIIAFLIVHFAHII